MDTRIFVVALCCFFGLLFKYVNGEAFEMNEQNLAELPDFPAEVTKVYVSKNFLTNIPDDAFDNITNLVVLIARENQITEFPDFGIQKANINIVDLSRNQISYMETEKLEGLTNIKTIMVQFNKLYAFPDVSSITTLEHLGFYVNKIPRVHSNFLPVHNTKLLRLYGSENPLDLETVFQDIKPIRGILEMLSFNKIGSSPTFLRKENLEGFDQLRIIVLSSNNFRRLPDFHHQIHQFESIYIQGNPIESVDYYDIEPFFYNTSNNVKINKLDLTQNNLKTFPCIKTLKKTLNELILTKNSFHCDCRLHDLLQEVKNSGNTFPEVDAAPCVSPPSFVGVHWNDITLDDLSCKGDSPPQLREFKKAKIDFKKMGPYLETSITESVMRCMRVCIENKDCWSFNFDERTGQCELIKHSECDFITAPGWKIYDSQ